MVKTILIITVIVLPDLCFIFSFEFTWKKVFKKIDLIKLCKYILTIHHLQDQANQLVPNEWAIKF